MTAPATRATARTQISSRWHATPRWLQATALIVFIATIAAAQTHSLWDYRGDRVDESELVHFAVGFLGGDPDPGWYGYGSLGMYLLAAVYALLAIPMVWLGPFEDMGGYAQQLFTNGFFFVVARYVFAMLGVATVLLYADLARRARVPMSFVAAYVVVAVTSFDAFFFANFLRVDRLVSFFVALCLWSLIRDRGARGVYGAAFAAAAATAAKMSALPLMGLVAIAAVHRMRTGRINQHAALSAGLLALVALFVFQPFVDYPDRLAGILGRGTESPFRWTAELYRSPVARLAAVADALVDFVGPALLLVPGIVWIRGARRELAWSFLAVALLIVPYTLSPEVRDYWFIPVAELIRFLALLGGTGIILAVQERWPHLLVGSRAVKAAVGVLLVIALAWQGVGYAAARVRTLATTPASNQQLAQSWLENEVLGQATVVIDGEFGYRMPRVYDPEDFTTSKLISRAFIFERWNHPFLNEIFARYLIDVYAPAQDLPAGFPTVKAVRLDLGTTEDRRFELGDVRLCHTPEDRCIRATDPVHVNDLAVVASGNADYEMISTGSDPHLVLMDDLDLPSDGSWALQFDSVDPFAIQGSIYLDLGWGFSESLKFHFSERGSVRIPLTTTGLPEVMGRVVRMSPRELDDASVRRLRGSYFVTSPASYLPLLQRATDDLNPERRRELQGLRQGYRRLLDQELVRRFDHGNHVPIEIYRIP